MRWVRFVFFVLVVTLLQTGLLDVVAVTQLHIKPDLLLILLVFFAVYCDTTEAVITSFAIGFASDLANISNPMGPCTISFGLFGTLLAYLRRVVNIKKMPYQGMAIFITGLLAGLLAHLLMLLKGPVYASNISATIFWTSLYSGFVGPFLFLPCAWWMRIKTHRFR